MMAKKSVSIHDSLILALKTLFFKSKSMIATWNFGQTVFDKIIIIEAE